MKSTRCIALCFILFFLGIIFTQKATALMATPMEFDIQLAPGKVVSKTINVSNSGKSTMSLSVSIKDYYYDKDGKKQESDSGIIPEGLGQWISVSPMKFDLEPGVSRSVTFTINLPADVSGSHWATIYIAQTSKPKPAKAKQGATVLQIFTFFRVAVRVIQFDPSVKDRAGHIRVF